MSGAFGQGGQGNPLLQQALQAVVTALNNLNQTVSSNAAVQPVYTTGSWTPTISFGGFSTGVSYSSQVGTYTQIGREVVCRFRMVLSSGGSSTGAATLGGLPLTPNANAPITGAGGFVLEYAGMSGLTSFPAININASSTVAGLAEFTSSSSAALTNSNFTSSAALNGQFSFFT